MYKRMISAGIFFIFFLLAFGSIKGGKGGGGGAGGPGPLTSPISAPSVSPLFCIKSPFMRRKLGFQTTSSHLRLDNVTPAWISNELLSYM